MSETTEEDKALTEGVKPDLVQGIEFAYTLPAVDLVVMSHTRTHTSVVSFSTLVDFCLHL